MNAKIKSGNKNPSELLILGLGNPQKGAKWWVLADWNGKLHALAYDHDPGGAGASVAAGPFANKREAISWMQGKRGAKQNPKLVTADQAAAMQDKALKAIENFGSDDPNDIAGMSVSEYAEHKGLTISNPAKWKKQAPPGRRRNSEPGELERGKELYRGFHGKEPELIRELAIRTEVQKTYVYGGDFAAMRVLQDDGEEWKIEFYKDRIKLASNPNGNQLYLIGGNQDIISILKSKGFDTSKELIPFGRFYCVYYIAAKSSTDFKLTEWEHYFGCVEEVTALLKQSEKEGWSNTEFQSRVKKIMDAVPPLERDLPELLYDRINQRILIAGGSYYVDWPGIVG